MTVAYTVALCTHNHADRLERTLADLAKLKSPEAPWEFLVIDNGCRDATPELLARHAWPAGWQVRVVREDKLGLSNARNRAIAEARGEYVIFMDDDETTDPDWLCAYERLILDKRPDAFGGRIRVLFEDMRPPWLSDELLGFLGELNRAETIVPLTDPYTSFYGGNFGFRKAVCDTRGRLRRHAGAQGQRQHRRRGGGLLPARARRGLHGLVDAGGRDPSPHPGGQARRVPTSSTCTIAWGAWRRSAGVAAASRLPPPYLFGQLLRALAAAWAVYRQAGRNATLRKEMNVAYFLGQIRGWAFGPRPSGG